MIKTLTRKLTQPFRRFAREEKGAMVLEVLLTIPVFAFCTIGTYTYWDAFRSLNTAQKATYTVADMISRETREINTTYLTGLHDVLQYMVGDDLPVQMRVSSITYSGVRNRFEIDWSRSPNNELPQLTTTTLQSLVQYIPMLADGDSIVLVESNMQFTPAFQESPAFFMYVGDEVFRQFIVTRPRFVPKICLQNVACSNTNS